MISNSSPDAKFNEQQRLISERKGIHLGVFYRENQSSFSGLEHVERFIFIRSNETYLGQEVLNRIPLEKMEEINKLAQITFDAIAPVGSGQAIKRSIALSSDDFSYMPPYEGKDPVRQMKSIELSNDQKEIYRATNQTLEKLEEILALSSERDLERLNDQAFVRCYNFSRRNAPPSKTHEEIYKAALRNYARGSLNQYLQFLQKETASKEISTLAEPEIGQGVNVHDKMSNACWLTSSADFTNKEHVRALFKAIEKHGKTHLTAAHSFLALQNKVKESFYKHMGMDQHLESSTTTQGQTKQTIVQDGLAPQNPLDPNSRPSSIDASLTSKEVSPEEEATGEAESRSRAGSRWELIKDCLYAFTGGVRN